MEIDVKLEKIALPIEGMHCAGCANAIERSLKKTEGVEEAAVNLTLEKAQVRFDPSRVDREKLIEAVRKAGYDVKAEHVRTVLHIGGMHCAGCSNAVERQLRKVPGVIEANVSIATEKAVVTYDAALTGLDDLRAAVKAAGYEVLDQKQEKSPGLVEEQMQRVEHYRKLMIVGWSITAPIMLLMLAHMVFGWMIPYMDVVFLLAAIPVVFWVGAETHRSSWNVLRHGGTNMDVLISLGAFAAFATGVAAFFLPVASYAAIAAMIICFHITGRYLEFRAKGRTSQAIQKLLTLEAKTARLLVDGQEREVDIDAVQPGDVLLVKPGEKIPTDGVVIKGHSAVDESIATGESIPVEKEEGSEVIGATINKNGVLHVKATRVGKDTFLSQVIKLVEECQGTKVPIQEFADRVTAIFVPTIIVLALLTLAGWLVFYDTFAGLAAWASQFLPWVNPELGEVSLAIFAAVAVLVIACPCALGLATPTVLMVASGMGAENGILIRNGAAIQTLQEIDTIVLDKTGTITNGKPEVTDIVPLAELDETALLKLAAGAEKNSEHPVAEAVVRRAEAEKLELEEARNFRNFAGKGISCEISGRKVQVGNIRWAKELGVDLAPAMAGIDELESSGKTVMVVLVDGQLSGVIAVADTLKKDSREAIAALKKLGLRPVMVTGDNQRTARAIAASVGIEDVVAEVLPEDKTRAIMELQEGGKRIAMVGDGINDAPALTQADVGIAIGTGTDIAIESSDITLVRGDLTSIVKAVRLSRATFRKIKQNLFWAYFYNVIMIPIAMVGFLHPALAEAAMALSSVNVVSNSLRLRKISL